MKYLIILSIIILTKSFSQAPNNIRHQDFEIFSLFTVSSSKFDKYQIKDFVRAGSKVKLGNELDRFDVKEIISMNPNLVTVMGTQFDKFDMKDFLRAGAFVIITNKFDKYDAKEIIGINPAKVTIIATGFGEYAITEFVKAGGDVIIGED